MKSMTRVTRAVATALAVTAFAGFISSVPMTVSESFSNPDTTGTGAPHKFAAGDTRCKLVVDSIADARTDLAILGTVSGRPVHAPTNLDAWLRNVIAGFETRGIQVSFDANPNQDAATLVASMTLRIAWVSELVESKNATALWHMRMRHGDTIFVDRDFRGADTVLNWSSGDGELQRMVDRAQGRALDLMAAEVRSTCAANH